MMYQEGDENISFDTGTPEIEFVYENKNKLFPVH